MNVRSFIATNGQRVARAECGANGHWAVEFLLEGEKVRCLAADPRDPSIVYAGTQGNGVLRSNDRGKTWNPAGMEGQVVKSIAVSPTESGVLYAGTKPPMVFVSRDGGESWTELESFRRMRRWFWFTPAEPGDPYVQAIALSPTDANVIVAGIEFGAVLRSADGGNTWQGHMKGARRDCHSLVFHITDGSRVYEAGGDGAAFSSDGGITWQQPDPTSLLDGLLLMLNRGVRPSKGGLDRHYCVAVAADPARSEIWYVSASPGPFKAHVEGNAEAYIYRASGGAAWQQLSGGMPQPLNSMPYALLPDRDAPGHLYAGLSNGDVWHTADYGDHWQQLPFNLGNIWTAMIML